MHPQCHRPRKEDHGARTSSIFVRLTVPLRERCDIPPVCKGHLSIGFAHTPRRYVSLLKPYHGLSSAILLTHRDSAHILTRQRRRLSPLDALITDALALSPYPVRRQGTQTEREQSAPTASTARFDSVCIPWNIVSFPTGIRTRATCVIQGHTKGVLSFAPMRLRLLKINAHRMPSAYSGTQRAAVVPSCAKMAMQMKG
ncbi:hypothetical protein PLICRDRAFT_505112 [Plicaturopsis crispa FD-325 SS-3]|nr:hypothetical protein PLICRDRAFT_505112 [Plicaturopsis crispa FD-325 SS-3]